MPWSGLHGGIWRAKCQNAPPLDELIGKKHAIQIYGAHRFTFCCLIDQICGIFGKETFPVSKSSQKNPSFGTLRCFEQIIPKKNSMRWELGTPSSSTGWSAAERHLEPLRVPSPRCRQSLSGNDALLGPEAGKKSPLQDFPGPFLNGWFQWKIGKSWENMEIQSNIYGTSTVNGGC